MPHWPSGGRPRWRSTATSCATCSAPKSCASSSIRGCSPTSSSICNGCPTVGVPAVPTKLHDVLRTVGDLTATELDLRSEAPGGWVAELVMERRAIEVMVAGEARFAAADDAARLRDALGCALPLGLPAAFTEPVPRPLEDLIARYARTHGPFVEREVVARLGVPESRVTGALAALEADGRVVRGEFRPDGVRREWCDTEVLRQLRRRSLAALRREVEPVEQEALARFLPGWHGIAPPRRGGDAVVEALGVLAGAPIVASTLEHDVLAARVDEYRQSQLDELCTSGDVVWIGAGAIGSNDGRVRVCFADQLPLLAPGWERLDPPQGVLHDSIRDALAERGASFWNHLRAGAPGASDTELLAALWDLVWAGEVTNDSLAPLRALTTASGGRALRRQQTYRGRPRPGRLARIGPPAGAGRWSLVAPLLEPVASATEAAHATALQLVERHGVVTREAVLAEGVVGGYAAVYGVLKVLEERGQVRRGYFVSGLGAAQFALPGAVDRLREAREPAGGGAGVVAAPVVLTATDPAQPYGAALPWPDTNGRPARTGGALVVLREGVLLAWYDRRSSHLVTFPATLDDGSWAEALADQVRAGRLRKVELRKVDGDPLTTSPAGSEVTAAAKAAGFSDGYRGLVFQSR